MHRVSRFVVVSILIVGLTPFAAVAGPVLSFRPRIRGTVADQPEIFYRLGDGLSLEIEWDVSAESEVTLIPPMVQANAPVRVGDGDVNRNISKLQIIGNPSFPLPLIPGGLPLQVLEKANTDGLPTQGRSQRWRLGVSATYDGPGGQETEDSVTSSGASVVVEVHATDKAVDIDKGADGMVGTVAAPATLGWQFTNIGRKQVLGLGIWDENPAGIGTHTVALWNLTGGVPLAELTIDATDDPFPSRVANGRWIFASLPTPIWIDSGTYVIGATYAAGDTFRFSTILDPLAVTTASGLTFDGSRRTSGSVVSIASGPQFPDLYVAGESAYFGPNFLIAVPEPHSIVLVLTGGLAIALRAIRGRRRG